MMSRKTTSLGLAIAIALAASAPAPVAAARQNSNFGQYIGVEICNKTSGKVFVALSYLESPTSTGFVVEGWKTIGAYACGNYSVPRAGWFYYYIEDENDGYWGADDLKLCVEHPGPFRRVNAPNFTCDGSELKGFKGINPEGRSSYAVDITP